MVERRGRQSAELGVKEFKSHVVQVVTVDGSLCLPEHVGGEIDSEHLQMPRIERKH
jgi:hypothetical protein